MIGKLKGLLESVADDKALIDVNGVCYETHCSGRTLTGLPAKGEAVALFIETYVREDQLKLFGFISESEKQWFLLLMTVQGVGAKVALAILSTLSASELSSAIALQDKAMVGACPWGLAPKWRSALSLSLKARHLLAAQSMLACKVCKKR